MGEGTPVSEMPSHDGEKLNPGNTSGVLSVQLIALIPRNKAATAAKNVEPISMFRKFISYVLRDLSLPGYKRKSCQSAE